MVALAQTDYSRRHSLSTLLSYYYDKINDLSTCELIQLIISVAKPCGAIEWGIFRKEGGMGKGTYQKAQSSRYSCSVTKQASHLNVS